ncbi:MAG: hypothetical protein AAFR26_12980 [Cyanobacteria bacterium J06626_4]
MVRLTCQLQIPARAVTSTVTMLDAPAQTQTVSDHQIVGVDSVGKEPGKTTDMLCIPDTNFPADDCQFPRLTDVACQGAGPLKLDTMALIQLQSDGQV